MKAHNSRSTSYILFEELTKANLWIARLFVACKLEVRYLHLAPALQNRYQHLKTKHIEGLTYEDKHDGIYELFRRLKAIPSVYTQKVLLQSCLRAQFIRQHKLNKEQENKLAAGIERSIAQDYSAFIELGVFVEYLAKHENAGRPYLWATSDTITRFIEAYDHHRYKNLKPRFLEAGLRLFRFGEKAVRKLMPKNDPHDSASAKTTATPKDSLVLAPEQCEVLFFPHYGIYYSDLYVKDHYYSDSHDSPFHMSKILHLSMGEPEQTIKKSIEFYRANKIPHGDINHFKSTSPLAQARTVFRLVAPNTAMLILEILRYGITSLFCNLRFFWNFYSLSNCLEPFTKAKMAFTGHDILFSPVLSLALSVRGVKTIAVQERFLTAWYDYLLPVVDHYFVIGQVVADELNRKRSQSAIGQIAPIGPVRLDLIHAQQAQPRTPSRYDAIKSKSLLILALDTHSVKTEEEDRLAMAHGWKINRKFYTDLIALAQSFPTIHIVIKGKNADFMKLSSFSEIVRQLEQTPNISIEQDYVTFTPSRMVELADGIIALYTSLADEAMAAGKPVIIYDYFGIPSKFFDYEKLPAFASNFAELKQYVTKLIAREPVIDEARVQKLKSRFYSNAFDGKVRNRLAAKLNEIYSQLK